MISGLKISSKRKQLMGLVPIVGLMLIAVTLVGYSPERIANAERVVAVIRNQPHYTKIEGCGEANSGVLEINVTATGEGAMAGVKDCVKVITSSPDGYRFYLSLAGDKQEGALIRRSEGGNELVGDASKYQENEKIKGIDGNINVPKPLAANTWGFALNTKEDGLVLNNFDDQYSENKNFTPTDGSKWAKVPKQGEVLVVHETDKRNDTPNSQLITPTNPEGKGAEINFYYGVKVDSRLKEGVYAGKIVYTVVAKTGGSVGDLSSVTYLQDATFAMCALSPEGQEYNLIDKRDGKSYRVAKLRDGNCWMTQSLALELDKNKGLEVALSDIKINTERDSGIPPDDPPRPPEDGGSSSPDIEPGDPSFDNEVQPGRPIPMPMPSPLPKPKPSPDPNTPKIFYPRENSYKIENEGDVAYVDYYNSNISLIYRGNTNGLGYYGATAALVNATDLDGPVKHNFRGSICPKNWTLPQVNALDNYMPSIDGPNYKRYTNDISFDGLAFYNYIDEIKRKKDELKGDYVINDQMKKDHTFDLEKLAVGQTEDRLMAMPNGMTKAGNLTYFDGQLSVQGTGDYGVYWQSRLDYDYESYGYQHVFTLRGDMELFGIGKFSQERLYMNETIEGDMGRRIWKKHSWRVNPEAMGVDTGWRKMLPTAQVRCLMYREENLLHRIGETHVSFDS